MREEHGCLVVMFTIDAHAPWARICKPFMAPENRFPAKLAGTTTLFVVPARQAT